MNLTKIRQDNPTALQFVGSAGKGAENRKKELFQEPTDKGHHFNRFLQIPAGLLSVLTNIHGQGGTERTAALSSQVSRGGAR